MAFDSLALKRIAADMRRLATGTRVQRVFAVSGSEIAVELRRRLPRPLLLLSWSPEFGRLHLCRDAEPSPVVQLPFNELLRKHIRGATITDCRQVGFDRVLEIDFANCAGMGPRSRATLVAEIMGRRSNLILLDEDREITGCARHIAARTNRYRETLPGLDYVPPPAFDRIDPHVLTPNQLLGALGAGDTVWDVLRATVMGASEVFLDETCARGGVDPKAHPGDLPPAWAEAVCRAMQGLLEEADAEGQGYVYIRQDRPQVPEFAWPVRLVSHPELVPVETDDLSEALEELTFLRQVARKVGDRKERLKSLAVKALKRAQARESERLRALSEAEDAGKLRRRGELILANMHAIGAGVAEVTVTDYYEPDAPEVTITLDPHYSPQQNAQALFARYKRAQRIMERVPPLLEQARMERGYLEGVLEQIALARTPEELDQIEHELLREGDVSDQARKRGRPPRVGAVEPARTQSSDGFAILYGRTGPQNDVVMRAANPDDLWFHVKEGPGAHVVVRANGRPDSVPETTIREAAELAAGLSKWRTDSRADVNYTQARHLRKPPGAPPGFVTYTDFRTVTVQPKGPKAGPGKS